MSDFHSQRTIRSTRKAHVCEQCRKAIDIRSPAEYGAGIWEGDFYTAYTHVECQAAALEYANIHGLSGDEWPWFFDYWTDEPEIDHKWMLEKHPIVAARLGIVDEADE